MQATVRFSTPIGSAYRLLASRLHVSPCRRVGGIRGGIRTGFDARFFAAVDSPVPRRRITGARRCAALVLHVRVIARHTLHVIWALGRRGAAQPAGAGKVIGLHLYVRSPPNCGWEPASLFFALRRIAVSLPPS